MFSAGLAQPGRPLCARPSADLDPARAFPLSRSFVALGSNQSLLLFVGHGNNGSVTSVMVRLAVISNPLQTDLNEVGHCTVVDLPLQSERSLDFL